MALELTTATTAQLSGIRQSLGIPNLTVIYPQARFAYLNGAAGIAPDGCGSILDCKGLYRARLFSHPGGSSITTILNAHLLTELEDAGTTIAFKIDYHSLQSATLNQFFTDLPATTKTATINVAGNPGAAACDTSIATNKGYTVVTT
jgi:hypothetical protein